MSARPNYRGKVKSERGTRKGKKKVGKLKSTLATSQETKKHVPRCIKPTNYMLTSLSTLGRKHHTRITNSVESYMGLDIYT